MKVYEIKGVVVKPNTPTYQFSVTINANDQASAKRLVEMQYGMGGKIVFHKVLEKKN